jgi:hypothetical protein
LIKKECEKEVKLIKKKLGGGGEKEYVLVKKK